MNNKVGVYGKYVLDYAKELCHTFATLRKETGRFSMEVNLPELEKAVAFSRNRQECFENFKEVENALIKLENSLRKMVENGTQGSSRSIDAENKV